MATKVAAPITDLKTAIVKITVPMHEIARMLVERGWSVGQFCKAMFLDEAWFRGKLREKTPVAFETANVWTSVDEQFRVPFDDDQSDFIQSSRELFMGNSDHSAMVRQLGRLECYLKEQRASGDRPAVVYALWQLGYGNHRAAARLEKGDPARREHYAQAIKYSTELEPAIEEAEHLADPWLMRTIQLRNSTSSRWEFEDDMPSGLSPARLQEFFAAYEKAEQCLSRAHGGDGGPNPMGWLASDKRLPTARALRFDKLETAGRLGRQELITQCVSALRELADKHRSAQVYQLALESFDAKARRNLNENAEYRALVERLERVVKSFSKEKQ